jgi:PhzF family phenazine biosynthesis protein
MTIYQIDAFTDRPFSGNPAAVCITPEPLDRELMQNIAAEMNVAETAFVCPAASGYSLRWFTPEVEVDLCGHATLAAAYVLWDRAYLRSGDTAVFQTKSGILKATTNGDWISMQFPREEDEPMKKSDLLEDAIGAKAVYTGKNRMDYIVEVESEDLLTSIEPEPTKLEKIHTRGVIVTARSASPDFDFVSRFFSPATGVPEDPVTGSAHCCLGPYWQRKLNKDEFTAYQASRRGGVVKVRMSGDHVFLSGQAIHVFTAETKL